MRDLYLIDASGYLYRAYFAIPQMTNAQGEPTHALFGFIRSLLKILKDFQPTYMAALFDGPSSTLHRKAMYADYKAHRKGMPADLALQLPWAQEFCRLVGISTLTLPSMEADDVMASVAEWAAERGSKVYLCTSDKDMCQLVNSRISILNTFKNNTLIGPEEVEKQFGVSPSQMIDFLAITGDASDNIPGLSGFGPKTAAQLLQQFGSLDQLLEQTAEIPGKVKRETLIRDREQVLLSRRLATLHKDAPFPQEESFFHIAPSLIDELRPFYSRMNFASLLRELEKELKPPSQSDQATDSVYRLVDDLGDLRKLVDVLSQERVICLDTETTSVHPLESQLVGIGLGVAPGIAWYIPANGKLPLETILKTLKPLFENPNIAFYGHNFKYDYHVLLNYGVQIAHIGFDTLIASYLLNSHSRRHSLDYLSLQLFGKLKISIQELIGKGEKQISMREVPLESVRDYCCEDVDYTIRTKRFLEVQLGERGLNPLFYDLELPLLPILADMERRGIFVDTLYLQRLLTELGEEIKRLETHIHTLAGEAFNVNSPKQTGAILFDKLGIRLPKGSSSGRSVSAEVLERLRSEHPMIAPLLEYRSLEKLRSTYGEALLTAVNPHTHRIHCTFNQSGAVTGRLSCQDPNLQNIPVRTEMGRKIREAFRPQLTGWSYLSADYSQIELRLLAHLSEDAALIDAFHRHEDIHTSTASHMFQVPIDRISREQRHAAKTVNFGIMYGQQSYSLSQQLGVEPKTAAEFIHAYFERYPNVKEFVEKSKAKARETGKAITLLGRERLIPEITSTNVHLRAMAERLAVNTPIQGTQADLIKKAMLQAHQKLAERKLKAYMVLQIHDELLLEVPDEELEEVGPLVREIMANVMPLRVPLVVDIHIGKNWKEC